MSAKARDFIGEMRTVLDAEAVAGYVPAIVAAHVVEKLRATDPELLRGWLDAQAESFVRQAINARDASRRARHRVADSRSVFGRSVAEHAAGDKAALSLYLDAPYRLADGSVSPLRRLTHDDLNSAAGSYDARANANMMQAAFLRALARKVTTGTVQDHFTEDRLAEMWGSLAA